MTQETAFLTALEGAALIEQRGTTLLLTDLSGSIKVALVRPGTDAEASPGPSASASSRADPECQPRRPNRRPRRRRHRHRPRHPRRPPHQACRHDRRRPRRSSRRRRCRRRRPAISSRRRRALATIAYPESWSTLAEPAELACRYFDPEPITVPDDPATLETAVMVAATETPFADAIGAATDPANWDVTLQSDVTIGGLAATLVEAVATPGDRRRPGRHLPLHVHHRLRRGRDHHDPYDRHRRRLGVRDERSVATLMAVASTFTPPG